VEFLLTLGFVLLCVTIGMGFVYLFFLVLSGIGFNAKSDEMESEALTEWNSRYQVLMNAPLPNPHKQPTYEEAVIAGSVLKEHTQQMQENNTRYRKQSDMADAQRNVENNRMGCQFVLLIPVAIALLIGLYAALKAIG